MNFHALDLGDFAVFGEHPDFFENLVELLFVGHREDFLRGDLAMMELDATIGEPGNYGVMGDHDDGASLLMKFAKQAQYDFFVDCIEIACGFVGQDDFRIVNQSAGDADALLLAT